MVAKSSAADFRQGLRPPPPPEALQDDTPAGAQPRCYFCGKAIAEEEVRKTEYHVGHGHKILVMICPVCLKMKD